MRTTSLPVSFDKQKMNLWRSAFHNIQLMLQRRDDFRFDDIEYDCILIFQNSKRDRVVLFFHYAEKMGIDTLRYIIQYSELKNIRHIIIILQNTWSTNCKKVLENLLHFDIEVFNLDEFQFDITKSYYYVPHEKITNSEEALSISQLYKNSIPLILKSDPIAKYFKFEKGDIIKVHREDFGQNVISYRIVR